MKNICCISFMLSVDQWMYNNQTDKICGIVKDYVYIEEYLRYLMDIPISVWHPKSYVLRMFWEALSTRLTSSNEHVRNAY